MPPKYRLSLAIIAGLAVFGWHQWQEHRAATATETTRDASAQLQSVSEPKRKLGTLEFTPCTLPGAYGKSLEAQCTSVEVAEDPAQPQGRRIALNLAWLPARREAELKPDPVFFLAGGPGQSATESFPQLDPAFAELRKTRHVLLLDQRGTGKSNPLACPPSLIEEDEAGEDLAASVAQADACRDALASKADLRFYTTTDAVRDLDAVRAAIGAAQVNLVGVSYGTRVAQQYAMRHPAQARSIVLDSVVPNTLVLGNIWGRNLDDALALQFGQCEQDTTCREKLGNPRAELDTLLATLKRQPPLVRFRDARTHEWREQRLTEAHVAGLVRMYAYMPLAASLLPALIHDANAGNYASLMALSQMLADSLQESMAMGMQLSVVCSEDGDAIARSTADEGTVLGTRLTDAMAAQCQVWPKGDVPADFHQPLTSEVPALLLEGEFDPVTPPRYGEEVAQTLPNGRLLVLRGQGHNVIGAGCMPRLFARFIDTANAKALDARCLDDLAYAQPFTSFNGWNP